MASPQRPSQKRSGVSVVGAAPRSGKTYDALMEVLTGRDSDPARVLFVAPIIGSPLAGTGLADHARAEVKKLNHKTRVLGRLGRAKMCPLLASSVDEAGPTGEGDTELLEWMCAECPDRERSGTESARREAQRAAASDGDFWADEWREMVETGPRACPATVARRLAARRKKTHLIVTSAQSFLHPRGTGAHPRPDDLARGARSLARGRHVIVDECHRIDAFLEIESLPLQPPAVTEAPTLARMQEAKGSTPAFVNELLGAPPLKDGAPDRVARWLTSVSRWLHREFLAAVTLYRMQDVNDDLADAPGVPASVRTARGHESPIPISAARLIKRQDPFLKRLRAHLENCREGDRGPCLVCRASAALESRPRRAHRNWRELLALLAKGLAGQIVVTATPHGPWETQSTDPVERRWSFDIHLLDAHRQTSAGGHHEVFLDHTILRTFASTARSVKLLSATQLRETEWTTILQDHYPGTIQRPTGGPRFELLLERATRGQAKLRGDRVIHDNLVRPLLNLDPFVVARSKDEKKWFLGRFGDACDPERVAHARGVETEGVHQQGAYVLFLGPPWQRLSALDATRHAPLDESPDGRWWESTDTLEEINDRLRRRSMTEALLQGAARTGTREDGGRAVVLGCNWRVTDALQGTGEDWLLIHELPCGRNRNTKRDRFHVAAAFLAGDEAPAELTGQQYRRARRLFDALHDGSLKQPFTQTDARGVAGFHESQERAIFDWALSRGHLVRDTGLYRLASAPQWLCGLGKARQRD